MREQTADSVEAGLPRDSLVRVRAASWEALPQGGRPVQHRLRRTRARPQAAAILTEENGALQIVEEMIGRLSEFFVAPPQLSFFRAALPFAGPQIRSHCEQSAE